MRTDDIKTQLTKIEERQSLINELSKAIVSVKSEKLSSICIRKEWEMLVHLDSRDKLLELLRSIKGHATDELEEAKNRIREIVSE